MGKLGLGKELAALERYERRAFSRRKSAMREFDAAQAAEQVTRGKAPKQVGFAKRSLGIDSEISNVHFGKTAND
jgi:hypothetical protein